MNAQDVLNTCRTSEVELVRFIYCDFSGVQRGKITAVDDLANRLNHGINLTRAQMAFTLLDTVVPIEGMEPVGDCLVRATLCHQRGPSKTPSCFRMPADLEQPCPRAPPHSDQSEPRTIRRDSP